MPKNGPSFVMTNLGGRISEIKKDVGDLYGLRAWVEYGFRQCKQELGWTDYRLTNYEHIRRWGEIVLSAYWMISINTPVFVSLKEKQSGEVEESRENGKVAKRNQWDEEDSWKSVLKNCRLIIRPAMIL
ncbi:MAG: hypothetical protein AAGG02_17115 [Cyanobacteria bacterium P01_H01_bin.15]